MNEDDTQAGQAHQQSLEHQEQIEQQEKALAQDIYTRLKRPFDPKRISWRIGATKKDADNKPVSAIALAYIDARDVMQRLDEVFGLDWQCRYTHTSNPKITICEIGININGNWIWRSNGAGDSDIEAEKGATSDAFKRAAVLFGIGRYLYELPNVWCQVKTHGKTVMLDGTPELPKWATPIGYDEIMEKRRAK